MSRLSARALAGVIPATSWLPAWRDGLSRNALAGLAVWAVIVPQSMAYASLAGVPPVNGLYAALAGLVVYALLGPAASSMSAPAPGSPCSPRPPSRRSLSATASGTSPFPPASPS